MGDRNLMTPRWRSTHVKVIAARDGGRLIGSNVATRWGSFGFFGPLTVLPEYWDRGVAKRLLEATMAIIDRWGVRHTGLLTFPQSAKNVGMYQKLVEVWEGFGWARGATLEAGVNLAREDAYRRLPSPGYRVTMQGVAMQSPHAEGFNRADVYVIDDWR